MKDWDLSGIGLRPGCLLKAPLLMGNDLRNMSASTLGIYGAEEVIEVDQTWGKQAGFFRRLISLAKHSAERERERLSFCRGLKSLLCLVELSLSENLAA